MAQKPERESYWGSVMMMPNVKTFFGSMDDSVQPLRSSALPKYPGRGENHFARHLTSSPRTSGVELRRKAGTMSANTPPTQAHRAPYFVPAEAKDVSRPRLAAKDVSRQRGPSSERSSPAESNRHWQQRGDSSERGAAPPRGTVAEEKGHSRRRHPDHRRRQLPPPPHADVLAPQPGSSSVGRRGCDVTVESMERPDVRGQAPERSSPATVATAAESSRQMLQRIIGLRKAEAKVKRSPPPEPKSKPSMPRGNGDSASKTTPRPVKLFGGGRLASDGSEESAEHLESRGVGAGAADANPERNTARFHFSTRPEINKSDLCTVDILDERHARRRVRCVTWIHPKERRRGHHAGREEKFALKIAMRGKGDVHCRRVLNEKEVMVALSGSAWHAQLVNTYSSENNLYMLLEYAPAGSLDQHIEWGRGLVRGGVASARFYTACALLGLEHMHARGITHRDVKPGNFLIDGEGYVKLCDYGLSKFLPLGSRTSTFLGTLAYIPPEMITGEQYDHSVDLWGLAVTLHEMVTGTTPFEPNEMLSDKDWRGVVKRKICEGKFSVGADRVPLPCRLCLKSMLEVKPRDRLGAYGTGGGGRGGGCADVKRHPFFRQVAWSDLAKRKSPPPGGFSVYGNE